MDSLIKLNVTAATVMTKLVLPGMALRKRGAIVNVSSGSGRMVVPLLSEYSATKKYIEQFTICLAAEYSAKNVHVQCHVPMFVSTKLAKIRHASFMVPSPATYARASVAHLGYDTLLSPYWPHALQIWLYESAPTWLLSKVRSVLERWITDAGLRRQQPHRDAGRRRHRPRRTKRRLTNFCYAIMLFCCSQGAMMTHLSLRKRALKKLEAKKNQ